MSGRTTIIEEPRRRSRLVRWRDRAVVVLLWGAWVHPVWALARMAGTEASLLSSLTVPTIPQSGAYLADLRRALVASGIAVGLLLARGVQRRWCERRPG